MVILTWPFYLSGVARTEILGSGLIAHIPLGLKHVSIASISLKSAKL